MSYKLAIMEVCLTPIFNLKLEIFLTTHGSGFCLNNTFSETRCKSDHPHYYLSHQIVTTLPALDQTVKCDKMFLIEI